MAIRSRDREDLIREASGLPLRGEFSMPCFTDTVVIGFRSRDEASWFFGPDPVYQFDENQRLRRLFFDQERYAAAPGKLGVVDGGGRLVKLRQEQRGGRVRLARIAVPGIDFASIQRDWTSRLESIRRGIDNESIHWGRCSTETEDFQRQVIDWVNQFPDTLVVASSSRLRKRS